MLEPVKAVTLPMADSPSHLSNVLGHVGEVRAITCGLDHFTVTLSHSKRVATELAIALMEVKFHVELLVRVDSDDASRKEVACHWVCKHIQGASASTITVVVDAIYRSVTFMSSRVPCVLVSFHDIELRTPVSTNLVGITVFERIFIVLNTWHQDGVKSSDTATTHLAQVHIVLKRSSEHVWGKVLRCVKFLLCR